MIPIYKIDEINHNNAYTYFKYFFLAPVALLRMIGLLITFGLSNYTAKYFPNIYTQFPSYVYTMTKFVTFFCGFTQIKIKNKHNFFNGNCITVYNHISILDVFLLYNLYPFAIVIKESYGKFLKHIIKASNGFMVTKNGNNIQKILEISKKQRLLIAPEGAVTNGKYLIRFKVGAFTPLLPIQPVLLRYHYKYLNPFFSEDNPLIVIYRLLTQFVNRVTIEVLPLQYPLTDETPKEFAERVRAIMAQALNVSTLN
jgi:lysophosphatidylcholine acyltransferase/lyso-PAF acetyltransferase